MATDAGPGGKMEDLDLFYEQVKQIHGRGLWQTEGTAKKSPTLAYIWKYQDFRLELGKGRCDRLGARAPARWRR